MTRIVLISPVLPASQAGSFSATLQDDSRSDLVEIKGHLEIALLEKHFLREYSALNSEDWTLFSNATNESAEFLACFSH